MKNSTIVGVLVVLLVILGGWYVWSHNGGPAMPLTPPGGAQEPSGAAGSNSAGQASQAAQPGGATEDQGLGDASSPAGDGTGVSQNLILGINPSASLGNFLSAYNGMTVYTYAPDRQTPGKSACAGQCASLWPPYTVASADDIHVSAATTGAVGTIARADGSLQVTYDGQPLYFYAKDAKPGDATGQNVGGVWFVAKP